MAVQPVLIAGTWRAASSSETFQSENPATAQRLPDQYPVSTWADCDAALSAATQAAKTLNQLPAEQIALFFEHYAARLEARADELVAMAASESGLPAKPRLADVELPRTTGQLRQAAAAVRDGNWAQPTIDTKLGIRSVLLPLGPVWVFGPNNFPFAFNSIAGGDFVAALAAGNPVIAKANSSHPGTARLLAEEAHQAATETELPPGTIQLLYRTSHADGERLVADPRTAATAYTGSRSAGLKLKTAADAAGKPIYLELSSVNPLVMLPGSLAERGEKLAEEFASSSLMGTGQFCTNPGMVILFASEQAEAFIANVTQRFNTAPAGTLLSSAVKTSLGKSIDFLAKSGVNVLTGGKAADGPAHRYCNTLLRSSGQEFLARPEAMQTEAFGNAALMVVVDDLEQACQVLEHLEGNLTGCIYSHTAGADDPLYDTLVPVLRRKVGRLLNDKMPTGVAVSPAMNHGGPYPATGHPGFTAVGIPAALRRFAMLACYDNVRAHRLPAALQDKNPTGKLWRLIDGQYTQHDIGA